MKKPLKKIPKRVYVLPDLEAKIKQLSEDLVLSGGESEAYEAAANFLVECNKSQQAAIVAFYHLCQARKSDPEAAKQFVENVRLILGGSGQLIEK